MQGLSLAVIKYPGSSGVEEIIRTYHKVFEDKQNCKLQIIEYSQDSFESPTLLIIPGGSSFGDYLRPGALAKACKISAAIKKHASQNGLILGIGNGFQILCELGLLPGRFLINPSQVYSQQNIYLSSCTKESRLNSFLEPHSTISSQLVGLYGQYYISGRELLDLEDGEQILFRYCDVDGDVDDLLVANRSVSSIAGIQNKSKNIIGIFPRIDRSTAMGDRETLLGKALFELCTSN